MKIWQVVVLCAATAIGFPVSLAKLDNLRQRSRDADRADEKEHRGKCQVARVEFFVDCLKLDSRPRCEALWAQARGQVFDSPPDKPWADEFNCSPEDR